MSLSTSKDILVLMEKAAAGDEASADALFPIVYDQLHRLAKSRMRGERRDHTLQTTALIHEAYVSLVGGADPQRRFESFDHFIATAAVVMRRVLINHANARLTQKRHAPTRVHFVDIADRFQDNSIDLLALDQALDQLAALSDTQAKIVELRFFGGLSVAECAEVLGVSPRTVQYEWAHARAWLRNQLGDE